MSSTNKTENYELSQFVGTDIPSILNDYNGDMRKIDTALGEINASAGQSATDIAELDARINSQSQTIASINESLASVATRVTEAEELISLNSDNIKDLSLDYEKTKGKVLLSIPANTYSNNEDWCNAIRTAITENGLELYDDTYDGITARLAIQWNDSIYKLENLGTFTRTFQNVNSSSRNTIYDLINEVININTNTYSIMMSEYIEYTDTSIDPVSRIIYNTYNLYNRYALLIII